MKNQFEIIEDWEFNVLGIYNYTKSGAYDTFYKFIIDNHDRLDGDIVEAGVYQGKTICATSLLLKKLGSNKTVYGYDTFSGFPPIYHLKDDFTQFELMFNRGDISKQHFEAVKKNKEWREFLSKKKMTTANISSSGDFSGNTKEFVSRKIDLLGLDNIVLVEGTFNTTMTTEAKFPNKIMAVMMDCDLYSSYIDVFSFVWTRLVKGGFIYLDEYYSLKFPGGKLATDEFIKNKKAKLIKAEQKGGDFERWFLIKEG